MIPYATCMCPGRRYRNWVVVGASSQVHGSAVIQRLSGNSLCIKMAETEGESTKEEEEDSIVSKVVDRPITKRFFQTLHKRRPKHPIITPRIYKLPLIDACYNGNTDCLLSHCNEWAFNTFNLDIATGGRSLSILLVHLFHSYGLIETFQLDMVKVWRCFSIMEATYHGHNPYHNSVHAADVAQAMNCFLREEKIASNLTPVEAMSALIAAVGHDLDHPGVNQPFLVATTNHLVQLYQCSSVLENHHWRIAISCLVESRVFEHLSKDEWNDVQWQVRSLILATDITHQSKFLRRFKRELESGTLDVTDKENRHFTLQIALKCADLCNPCRPWLISQRWSHQVCQEFYRQGDYEKQLNLPITPTFDRSRTTVAKIQSDFFRFIMPLFETWHNFLNSPLSNQLVWNLNNNHCQWKMRVEQAQDETIPVAGLVLPHAIDIPSPSDKRDLYIPHAQQDFASSEGPVTRSGQDTSNLQTPSEELNPTTSVMSLSNQENVLKLQRVTVISEVETYFTKSPSVVQQQQEEEKKEEKECVNGCCTPPFEEDPSSITAKTPSASWCWHISRSLSEERTQQPSKDFDSPAHSWRGSANSLPLGNAVRDRRGSAPMALGRSHIPCLSDVIETCNGLSGGGRRWSIPSEPLQGTYSSTNCKTANKDPSGHHTSSEYEKKIYSVAPKEKLETESKSIYVSGSPIILSCVAPTARRGSLPTDLPISMMRANVKPDNQQSGIQWDHPRRRSAGELLSVLLGTASALTAIQSVDASTQRTTVYQRRGSDGLELLYGFWRTRRLDNKNLESAGQILAGRYKFPLALDPSSVIPDWSPKRENLRQFCTNYLLPTSQGGHSGISKYSEHLCQRRASVPVGVPTFSTNSGSPYRNYRGSTS